MDDRIGEIIEGIRRGSIGLFDESDLPVLDRLGNSAHCAIVWTSLDKRIGVAEELHARVLTEVFGDSNEHARAFAETDFPTEVWRLVGSVRDALSVPKFHESALPSARKRLLRHVKKSAEMMTDAISALDDEAQGLTQSVQRQLDDFARHDAESTLQNIQQWEGAEAESVSRCAASREGRALSELVALAVVFKPEQILHTLVKGIEEWSTEEPLIPRPNDENADRLRMIRMLTRHFMRRYGSPLRAQVLAVTATFFDTSDLSEADISKLAPARFPED